MSAFGLGRNDAYANFAPPAARVVEGIISRVNSAQQVWVICPGFDAGAEFGPARYNGTTPTVGAACLVNVMTGTTEAWIVSWDGPTSAVGGAPVAYAQITAPVAVSNGTEATANVVVTAPAFVADGTSRYWVEFFCPDVTCVANAAANGWLYQDGASIAWLFQQYNGASGTATGEPVMVRYPVRPSAGSHVYSIRVSQQFGGVTVNAGPGGAAATWSPAFIRITNDNNAGPQGLQGAQGVQGIPGSAVASWQGFWRPGGTDTNSGAYTSAIGTPELGDSAATPARILYTPPVDGVFSYSVEGIANADDAAWVRHDFIARIHRTSDLVQLAPEVKTICYAHLSGTTYCSWRLENRCSVLAGVPVQGRAYINPISGTWHYWQGASYLRAFAQFTPS